MYLMRIKTGEQQLEKQFTSVLLLFLTCFGKMNTQKNRNRLAVVIEGGNEDEGEGENFLRHPRRNRDPLDPPDGRSLQPDNVDGLQIRNQLQGFRVKVRQSYYALLPEFARSSPDGEDDDEQQLLEPASIPFLNYLTLKVLIWDIGITLGDTVTDLWQGVALVMTPGN